MNTGEVEALKPSSGSEPAQVTFIDKVKYQLRQNLILVLTLIGILGGITLGFIGRTFEPSKETITLIGFPGEMLLRVLKMLILPLIISSLIVGLAQLDPKSSGKMGSRAILFYVMSTLFATTTGTIFAIIMRPGRNALTGAALPPRIDRTPISTTDAMMDIIRNSFPDNIVQACTQSIQTTYKHILVNKTIGNDSLGNPIYGLVPDTITIVGYANGSNVMGLVVFCTIFGIFISMYKEQSKVMFDFFFVMNELVMKIVGVVMWYSPVGILFLVAANILKIDNMQETAERLSLYMITVIMGLAFHMLVSMQTVYFLITRKNPFRFLKGMLQAWLTAVGTASSSATLPITFRCLEENNKVDKRVTRFMLPLGATINMDGTALYQTIATVFIAQLNSIEFTIGQYITVCLISTATSIGVASVPSASLVTMLIVLSTMNLPIEHLSFIIAVDWLLDRLRTSVNVLGDSYGCGIVAHMSKKQLKEIDDKEELEMQRKNTVQFDQQANHKFSSMHDNMEDQASPKHRHQGKLPESITSMPQISVYQAPNFENQSA